MLSGEPYSLGPGHVMSITGEEVVYRLVVGLRRQAFTRWCSSSAGLPFGNRDWRTTCSTLLGYMPHVEGGLYPQAEVFVCAAGLT